MKGRYDLTSRQYTMITDSEEPGKLVPPIQEPEYVKVYINTQLSISNLNTSLAPYIIAFAKHMTYANDSQYSHMVRTDRTAKEDVARTCHVSVDRVNQIVKELVKSGVFIKISDEIETEGIVKTNVRRGIYFVNPFFIAKGDWQSIRKLQQKIDFVSGECELVIDDKKVVAHMPEAIKPPVKYHQLTMQEWIEKIEDK